MKKLSILGSTGFIGSCTLEIVARYPERFSVAGLAAGKNVVKLAEQIKTFSPAVAAVQAESLARELRALIPVSCSTVILSGQEGLNSVATYPEADMIVSAMVGASGVIPTMAAIEAGKPIALANKETLIVAGRLIMEEAAKRSVAIIPVDSEHNAVFQSLLGHNREEVERIILTASGGPFLHRDPGEREITPEEALNHPIWPMGNKITIDSATLMNKGLEVIEARWLFDMPAEKIDIVIHPQSVIHSMVEYRDKSTIAQLSHPDMRIPIAYALAYPDRLDTGMAALSLAEVGSLTFFAPDRERFPSLRLAYQALQEPESMTAVLNGANEVAVAAFLSRKIRFSRIPVVIEKTMNRHAPHDLNDISHAVEVNEWACRTARELISE